VGVVGVVCCGWMVNEGGMRRAGSEDEEGGGGGRGERSGTGGRGKRGTGEEGHGVVGGLEWVDRLSSGGRGRGLRGCLLVGVSSEIKSELEGGGMMEKVNRMARVRELCLRCALGMSGIHSYDIEDGNCARLQVDISAQENHVLSVLTCNTLCSCPGFGDVLCPMSLEMPLLQSC